LTRVRWILAVLTLALGVLISALELSASMRARAQVVTGEAAAPGRAGTPEGDTAVPGSSPSLTY